MHTRYFKRYRMEIDLRQADLPKATLPPDYRWRAWHPELLVRHAAVKCECFRREMDSQMFLALSSVSGCIDLMRGIVRHEGFLPRTTWLIEFTGDDFSAESGVGTIQGIAHSTTQGSIQNVGIAPEHRGLGLGKTLVLKSLAGFRAHGLIRVYLDVTAENKPAVALYESIGFRCIKTSYRELPQPVETR